MFDKPGRGEKSYFLSPKAAGDEQLRWSMALEQVLCASLYKIIWKLYSLFQSDNNFKTYFPLDVLCSPCGYIIPGVPKTSGSSQSLAQSRPISEGRDQIWFSSLLLVLNSWDASAGSSPVLCKETPPTLHMLGYYELQRVITENIIYFHSLRHQRLQGKKKKPFRAQLLLFPPWAICGWQCAKLCPQDKWF